MNPEPLRIVTVAYNPGDELALCVESATAATSAPVDFVIVDNGRERETVDSVARAYGATVVRPGRNLGYGVAPTAESPPRAPGANGSWWSTRTSSSCPDR